MAGADQRSGLFEHLARMAPGTPLRDGFERILRGRTGALVVLGRNHVSDAVSTGGFGLDVPFSPTALRELAKMDGAIVLDLECDRIVSAGVQLMPDASIGTVETGTRHRTADRVARQSGLPVVSVSASMSTISLFIDGHRHVFEQSDAILSRANQALQTLERYRARVSEVTVRLSSLEVQDQVTVSDVALVAQRLEMVRRLNAELDGYVVELGSDGRLLALQLYELSAGLDDLRELLERDYRPDGDAGFSFASLAGLDLSELLDPLAVARTLGFGGQNHLDTRVSARGYRQVAQINRLPVGLGARLIEHFGSLQALFGATSTELQAVEGVGESRARTIRDGLLRLADAAYDDRVD
ncbi:MAG: DNA integrity scanning protein DisA [uncultured Friedmanniella sp.]|uniref:DNA integrity scanning protein DisA n=1 Tax=uncultured Friedmanniella sp. TaxID=335381 RepID=A0A6J4KBM1_9ACTN|nr:MAG: DNA integrity scanning protein DisA [uncultured Friedmanniella sp.]